LAHWNSTTELYSSPQLIISEFSILQNCTPIILMLITIQTKGKRKEEEGKEKEHIKLYSSL
jgi:hypothetical protein